jgi:signal transduction histidine kinase
MQGPKTERGVLNTLRAALEKFEPTIVQLINYHKDGSEYWIEMSLVPLMDEIGCYTHWVSVQRDITLAKQAEEDRAQLLREQIARAEAEAANCTKDEFLATVSHELRSPLNAILGWAQILRSSKLDSDRTNKALEVIERNAKAQKQIIEDLLDVSRIIRGEVRLQPQPTHLVQAIEAAIDIVHPSADAKMIQVLSYLDPAADLVWGDPDRLKQIVWNLLSNAVKFTPVGGEVKIWLTSVNSQIQIKVSDTGIGISPDFLPHVFDRFRQAENTSNKEHGGLGLGLAIVRQLVELHDGTIQVESPGVGQGATFTVQLPAMANSETIHLEQLTTSSDTTS